MSVIKKIFSAPLMAAILILAAVICLTLPDELLIRISQLQGAVPDRRWSVYGLGLGLFALGLAVLFDINPDQAKRAKLISIGAVSVALFVAFTQQIDWWWIDDAGITFAYSRSLADGFGITFQPNQPPTEGYSTTLWMLCLALTNVILGADIPETAKALGIIFGAMTILVALHLIWDWTQSFIALVVGAVAMSTSPFVVWAASGQEHALQGLLLTLIVYSAVKLKNWQPAVAVFLALLIFTRPETPLIVIAVFCGAVASYWSQTGSMQLLRNAVLLIIPGLAFAALMGWRMWYFGDPFPNPYYAKGASTSFKALVHPFGGGWTYVLNGFRDTGLMILLPFIFLPLLKIEKKGLAVLASVAFGHVFFVLWANGDWMAQYRFLMPAVALFVIPATVALATVTKQKLRPLLGAVLTVFVLLTTIEQLDEFEHNPTTPLSVVSEIGQEFVSVAERLQIEDALLAHHDAGGISYDRDINFVDLGGLVDRKIAKNMDNRPFLERYIFEERRPHFIFGGVGILAAASGFTESPVFESDYVPISFVDRPIMDSDLSHIRRDAVREALGITIERNAAGAITQLIVMPLSAQ